jgi:hypothetical protein
MNLGRSSRSTLFALKRRIMKKIRRKDSEIEADDAINLFIKCEYASYRLLVWWWIQFVFV